MAKGFKSGGRTAGTPNRKTAEVSEILASLDCDPIEGMVRIAMDEKHSPELRGRMFAELAQYSYPKRKAVEHTGSLTTGALRRVEEMTDDELAEIILADYDLPEPGEKQCACSGSP